MAAFQKSSSIYPSLYDPKTTSNQICPCKLKHFTWEHSRAPQQDAERGLTHDLATFHCHLQKTLAATRHLQEPIWWCCEQKVKLHMHPKLSQTSFVAFALSGDSSIASRHSLQCQKHCQALHHYTDTYIRTFCKKDKSEVLDNTICKKAILSQLMPCSAAHVLKPALQSFSYFLGKELPSAASMLLISFSSLPFHSAALLPCASMTPVDLICR